MQDFCRRIGIAVDDLFSILGTRFVNPATALLSRLETLNVPFTTLVNKVRLPNVDYNPLPSP